MEPTILIVLFVLAFLICMISSISGGSYYYSTSSPSPSSSSSGSPVKSPSPGSPVKSPSPGSPVKSPSPGSPVKSPSPGSPGKSPSPGSPGKSPSPEIDISILRTWKGVSYPELTLNLLSDGRFGVSDGSSSYIYTVNPVGNITSGISDTGSDILSRLGNYVHQNSFGDGAYSPLLYIQVLGSNTKPDINTTNIRLYSTYGDQVDFN
jgi:hypothetical protein